MSHVLQAMSVPKNVAMGTLRISTGLKLTEKEAEEAADYLIETIRKMSIKTESGGENGIPYSDLECKLTKTTHGLGCGCKISPKVLSELIKNLPVQKCVSDNPSILVGNEHNDDSCVYKLDQSTAIIKSLDFLTPICDDPTDYGAIACSNALSDIYAMGGCPILALNIVAFPVKILPLSTLSKILLGAQEKADEANVPILGGHSIEDNEPKYGMSVTGLAHPDFIWKNSTIKHNDVIILTKKIGTGVIMTALKRNLVRYDDITCKEVIESMKTLNKYHCDVIRRMEKNTERIVSACTDVTGFGLLGHLKECLEGSKMSARINFQSIEFFEKAKEFIEMNVIPGGTLNNYTYTSAICKYDDMITQSERLLINDAQTSGGLLLFIPQEKVGEVISEFEAEGLHWMLIGQCCESINGACEITVIK